MFTEKFYLESIDLYQSLHKECIDRMNQYAHSHESYSMWFSQSREWNTKINRLERRFVKYHDRYTIEDFSSDRACILDHKTGLIFHLYYDTCALGEYDDAYVELDGGVYFECTDVEVTDLRIIDLIECEIQKMEVDF